ncbi:apolipoprotein C-I [Toxotes jaculatrix]|uniref:apolipoprotein C-I n=1 Tax=Toxotes jaculatrix TaxID=941984 RepID=UPI001B3B1B57|nr:apolipoprotein C-I [Toxotes jaculatrix]
MRLYLAVAVLMLAFVAYTEAQEETFTDRLTSFGEQLQVMARELAEKAKTAFKEVQNSDVAVNSKNWIQDQFEKLTNKVKEHTQ